MKLRKLLVIGLLSGSMVLSSTGSVLASEEYTREVKCKVGATLTMGEVVQVLKDEDKVVKLENGKVNLLKEGDCLVVLSTGETIHLVVMNEDNPETSELGKGVIAEIPAEEEEQEVNDVEVSSDPVEESEIVEDVESEMAEAKDETDTTVEAETEVETEKNETTQNDEYADVNEETEKETSKEGIDTRESEETENKGSNSAAIESATEVEVPLAPDEKDIESSNSDEVTDVIDKEVGSEKGTEVETQKETNSQANTEGFEKESKVESIKKKESVLEETETEASKTGETEEETKTLTTKETEKGVKELETSSVNEKELGKKGSGSDERVTEVSKETETPNSEDDKKDAETELETEVKNEESEKETEPKVNEDTKLGLDDINPDAPLDEGAVIDDTVPLTSDVDTSKSKDGTTTAETTSKIRESSHTGVVGTYFVLPILEGEAGEYISTNEDVARVSSDGVVYFSGVGKAKIIVSAQDKIYTCNVTSLNPEFDNSDVILDWDVGSYTIELGGDYLGEKVSYSIVSGEDIASVSEDGVVTFSGSGTVIVRASVAGMEFNKRIIQNSRRKKLWDGMQGAIQQCLGTPYVFGGFAPGSGLDCSGYVSYVYNTVGLMSGRTTAQGLYNMFGLTSNPQPGDVVYFAGTYDCPDYITHVGIYAGDGMMYHSGKPNQKTAIVGYYAEHLVGYGSITGE